MSPTVFEDSDPAEIEAAQQLEVLFARLHAAEVRCDDFAVRAGSELDVDDRATAYDPISYQVRFLFVAAFDHVGTFRRTLESGMPTVAGYPLVRASLECAAQVLWLTTGGTRAKRTFRGLQRVWDAASFSDTAILHLNPDRPLWLPGLRTRLEELLAAVKGNQRRLTSKYPSMTTIVTEAGKRVESRRFQPIDVWRLCSSMAHANPSVSLMVLERRQHGPGTDIGATYLMTTSYRVMAAFIGVLVDVVEAALDARDHLNRADRER